MARREILINIGILIKLFFQRLKINTNIWFAEQVTGLDLFAFFGWGSAKMLI